MREVEKRVIGHVGDGVPVTAEIAAYSGGTYRARIVERPKGAPAKVQKVADGLPDEKLAWAMLDVFVSSYEDAIQSDGNVAYEPVRRILTDVSEGD